MRYLTMPTGAVVREYLVTVDDEARRLAYSAVEGFRLPIEHHHASFQVFPDGDRARFVWITAVLQRVPKGNVDVRIDRGAHRPIGPRTRASGRGSMRIGQVAPGGRCGIMNWRRPAVR